MNAYRMMKRTAAMGMLLLAVLLAAACTRAPIAAPAEPAAQATEPAAAAAAAQVASTTDPVWPTTQEPQSMNPSVDGGCPYVLDDGKFTSEIVWSNMRGYRYTEVFITCPGGGPTGIYNTTGSNIQPDDSKDSAPDDLIANYSDQQVAQDYHADRVYMEGVRHWVYDRNRFYISHNVRNLDGIDTHWGANVAIPKGVDMSKGQQFYKMAKVTRDSTFWYEKGKPVFLLDAPNGMTFVMQSYTLANEYEDLAKLGDRLKLPEGWSFRSRILDQDLTINGLTVDGKANQWIVTQDAFVDSYSACWEADGQSSCNYRP
jgi:hypothetical protein